MIYVINLIAMIFELTMIIGVNGFEIQCLNDDLFDFFDEHDL